jgi:hypothetical protein
VGCNRVPLFPATALATWSMLGAVKPTRVCRLGVSVR